MRTNKAIKNIFYSLLSYSSLFILSLILRKVFLRYLDMDFLGIEGVLGNLFSLMALVDVGTGSLITYLLYKAFSDNNKKEISILMGMYRNMYLLIALAMTILSVLLIPLLPFLLYSETIEWQYVIFIYLLKLMGMIGSYCYSYRRLLFKVDQCEYLCTKIDMVSYYIKYISWFSVLLAFQSYFLYLFIEVIAVVGANIYIACLSQKRYPYAAGEKVGLKEYRERNFLKDMKNTYAIKIAGTMFGSTSNLVISTFLGLKAVALLSNYLLITNTISQGFSKLLMPLQGSIGNYVYQESREKSIELFKMFDVFAFILGSIVACCFATIINNFIIIWLGENYVFDKLTVLAITLNLYFGFVSHFTTCFREVLGRFELDRNFALGGAVVNIVISIVLVKVMGVAGVYFGTIIGIIGFWVGRYRVLKIELFKRSIGYLLIQTKFMLQFLFLLLVSLFFTCQIENSVYGLFFRTLISVMTSLVVNLIAFRNRKELCMIKNYIVLSLTPFKDIFKR